jgi:hypothetical protein
MGKSLMETGEEDSKLYLITALFKEALCNAHYGSLISTAQ